MSDPRRVVLHRVLAADVERVFRAFTDPAEALQWWGPAGITTSAVEIDLRPGGRCRWVMHPGGGTAVLHGRVLEVDPPHLLVMTNQWEGNDNVSVVTLRLSADGPRTRLELVHEQLPDDVDPAEYDRGWTAALRSLEQYLTHQEDR